MQKKQPKLSHRNRKNTMKKLYSHYLETRIRQHVLANEAQAAAQRSGTRLLSAIHPDSVLWRPIVAKTPSSSATRWIE